MTELPATVRSRATPALSSRQTGEGSAARSAEAARASELFSSALPPLPTISNPKIALTQSPAASTLNRKTRRARSTPKVQLVQFAAPKSLEERVFDRLTQLKIRTAQVAMHLDKEWRHALYRQLDFLMEADAWPADMPLPTEESFGTFLKFIIHLRPKARPSLGVEDDGSLVGNWTDSEGQLFVIFQGGEDIRWSALQTIAERIEVISGRTTIDRLIVNASAYNPARWFSR